MACLDSQTLSGVVGLCHGGPFVLCPSYVMVEDIVVCHLDLSSLVASGKAFKCLALVLARDISGANSIVVGGGSGGSGGRGGWFASGWICSIFGKR